MAGATSSYPTKSAVSNTLASYLTSTGAVSLYPTKDAVSNTLTSYLTSTVANNTYAPKASPTFTGVVNVNDISIGGKLLLTQYAAFVSPTLSLNLAWAGGATPIFSRLGRWTGGVHGGNINTPRRFRFG